MPRRFVCDGAPGSGEVRDSARKFLADVAVCADGDAVSDLDDALIVEGSADISVRILADTEQVADIDRRAVFVAEPRPDPARAVHCLSSTQNTESKL